MKIETILRITCSGSAVAAFMRSTELSNLINEAFAKKEPQYTSIEIVTTDGEIILERGKHPAYSEEVVKELLADLRFQKDRNRPKLKRA